jgi:hypothetical protein
LTNPNSIQKIASGNTNLADKIVSSIRTAKAQIKDKFSSPYANKQGVEMTYSQLNEAEKLWNNALQQTAENKGEVRGDNVVRNSIIQKDNGDYKIIADRDIFKDVAPEDRNTVLKNFINENIRGNQYKALTDSEVLNVAQKNKTVQKLWRPGIAMYDAKYEARQNAAAHYDEALEASKKTSTQEAKNDKHNQTSVDKRNVEIEIPQYDDSGKFVGSSVWDAEISVLNNDKTAYDISRLKDITKDAHSDLSNLQKANPDIDRASLADMVSQQDNFVKRNEYKNVNDNSEPLVKNSLKENTSIDIGNGRKIENMNEIVELINDNHERTHNNVYAIRGDDRTFNVGDEIPKSSNFFDESESYGSELNGTSGTSIGYLWFDSDEDDINSIRTAIENNLNAYRYKNLYVISGTDEGYGTDNGETLVGNAEVVGKIQISDNENNNEKMQYSLKENVSSQQAKNDLSTDECQKRFAENVDKVFSGEMPSGKTVIVGDTPELLQKYGASNVPITINQNTMYKIAYPIGYFGAEEQGHNLGIPALKQLTKQIADPVAIIKSNSQDNSLVLLTEWNDTKDNPVIIPLHLDKNGIIGISNEVSSMYGKENFEALLTDREGNSTVLYTKNNEDIHQLLPAGLQLPEVVADDTLVGNSISQNEPNVKYSLKENSTTENMADELIKMKLLRSLRIHF